MNPRTLTSFAISLVCWAGSPAPAVDNPHFVGRWDRRDADRAVTVNSGSYVLARFDGPGVSARFDVSANKPPLPTITWRMDDGDWQEAEVAAECATRGEP